MASDGINVVVSETPSNAWLAGSAEANATSAALHPAREALLRRIAQPVAFACVEVGGSGMAWGLAAAEGEWEGAFEVSMAPEARGRGFGRVSMEALIDWAAEWSVESMYLRVGQSNDAARRLYERIRFEVMYPYHYRVLRRAASGG